MKILFIHDHLFLGGAAKAALRMRRLCEALGHETLSLHGDEATLSGTASLSLHGKPRGLGKLWEKLAGSGARARLRQARAEKKFREILERGGFDGVWFQNIAGAAKWGWSDAWVEAALQCSKVMITLHDMHYLGVGQPYVWDQPVEPSLFAGLAPSRVQDWVRQGRLRLNACSLWLGRLCGELYGLPCGQLPVPLREDDFHPGARTRSSPAGTEILVAAEHLGDPRKNILPTLEVLLHHGLLERSNARVLCLGRNLPERFRHPRIVALGHAEDSPKYRAVYDQVDFLLHPSLADNFPLLIQESLAQGRPVVALDRGGVGELVISGQTGNLLPGLTPSDLGQVLLQWMRMDENAYRELSGRCLGFAKKQFFSNEVAGRYREALEEWQNA